MNIKKEISESGTYMIILPVGLSMTSGLWQVMW